MPLILLMLGKSRFSERRELYIKYGDDNSRSNKSSKFNRMVDLGSSTPLPEGVAHSSIKDDARNESDDAWLVQRKDRTGEILVTNQIVQVSQPTSRGEVTAKSFQ